MQGLRSPIVVQRSVGDKEELAKDAQSFSSPITASRRPVGASPSSSVSALRDRLEKDEWLEAQVEYLRARSISSVGVGSVGSAVSDDPDDVDSIVARLKQACSLADTMAKADLSEGSLLSKEQVRNWVRSRTTDELDKFRKTFREFDADGSGGIDDRELMDALAAAGSSAKPEQVMKLVTLFDADASGALDFGEFLSLMANLEVSA